MAFNGSGVHNRVHDWTQDLNSAIPVTASRMDAEHDDISAALSNTICRDGQSTTAARIPFASGVSAGGGTTSSVAYGQSGDPNTGLYFPGADQWGMVAGGTSVLSGTSSGVSVTGTHAVSGNATVGGTFAAAGDITHHGQPIVPVGAVLDFAGTSAPNGWLLCFGQAVSRSTYSALFSALGTIYGSGDGSTTFNLPDLRGRVVAGKDDMGGSSANRLTNQSGGLNGDALGASGGSETHTLTEAQLATHNHSATDGGHTHTYSRFTPGEDFGYSNTAALGGGGTIFSNSTSQESSQATGSGSASITVGNTGSGTAHNNVQPTIILNKIIYAGVYT